MLTSLSVIEQMVCFDVEFEVNRKWCTVSAELVMDLKSSDDEVSKKAMEKADCFIAALEEPCRTKVNRTSINTTPSRQDSLVKAYILYLPRIDAQSHLWPTSLWIWTRNLKKHLLLFPCLFYRIYRTVVQVSMRGHFSLPHTEVNIA